MSPSEVRLVRDERSDLNEPEAWLVCGCATKKGRQHLLIMRSLLASCNASLLLSRNATEPQTACALLCFFQSQYTAFFFKAMVWFSSPLKGSLCVKAPKHLCSSCTAQKKPFSSFGFSTQHAETVSLTFFPNLPLPCPPSFFPQSFFF